MKGHRVRPPVTKPLRHAPGIDYIPSMFKPAVSFFFFGFFLPLAEGIDRRC